MLLLLSWPPVCAVCRNHEVVVFQPWTAPDLSSITLIIKNYSSHLPPHLFWPFLDLFFPSQTWLLPLPVFHPLTPIRSLVASSSLPQLVQELSDRPPGRISHLTDYTACLCLSTLLVVHTEFLTWACDFRPSPGYPPFIALDLFPGPYRPHGFSLPRVPSYFCLPM